MARGARNPAALRAIQAGSPPARSAPIDAAAPGQSRQEPSTARLCCTKALSDEAPRRSPLSFPQSGHPGASSSQQPAGRSSEARKPTPLPWSCPAHAKARLRKGKGSPAGLRAAERRPGSGSPPQTGPKSRLGPGFKSERSHDFPSRRKPEGWSKAWPIMRTARLDCPDRQVRAAAPKDQDDGDQGTTHAGPPGQE